MDNPNIVLIKAIVALYVNSNLPNPLPKVSIVVDEVMSIIRKTKQGAEEEVTNGLMTTLEYFQYVGDLKKITPIEVIERVKLNCYHRHEYESTISNLLSLSENSEDNLDKVNRIISEIRFTLRKNDLADIVRRANRELNFNDTNVNIGDFSRELTERLRAFENISAGNGEKEGFAGRLSTSDPESIKTTFERAAELNSAEGMLVTGSKGINRMLGGGYRRGGQYLWGGLTGNYKTGMLLDNCKWIPMHNTPKLLDPKKKPMVLRVSFENKPEQDLPIIYESIYSAEYKTKVNKSKIDKEEATKYVLDKLGKNGWTFEMLCYDPNNFDIWDLIDILVAYEEDGYEIAALIVDYPELITKKQRKGNEMRQDAYIVYTFEVLRNHCFPRGITQIVAHQHSTEAQKIKREDPVSYVSKITGGSYYMNCQSLATKVDADCAMNIVTMGERKFLMLGMGKDRFNNDTPEKHRFPILEFKKFGGILADVDTDEDYTIYSFAGIDSGVEVQAEEPRSVVTTNDDDW